MSEPGTDRARATPAELARRLHVTRQAIYGAVRVGRLSPPGPDGLLDVETATREWSTNRHPTVGNGSADAQHEGRGRSHRDRYWRAKAVREEAEAGLSVLKQAAAEKTALAIGDHRDCVFTIATLVRENLLNTPARVAAGFAAAVRDALADAGASPELIGSVPAATTAGAARILDAEMRRVLVALQAVADGVSVADLREIAARWRSHSGDKGAQAND